MISRKILLIVVALAFAGCATPTKPNLPYLGPLPGLDKIERRNPRLATELRKLPEFQDGVSPSEASALEKVVNLYHNFPDNFDKAFGEMYEEGYPDIREYCSPLQALLWGYIDGKFKQDDWPMKNYKTILEFVNSVWEGMEGPRWDGFDEVTSRLNLPELVNLYKTKKLVYYSDTWAGDAQHPEETFKRKGGDCEDYALFIAYCLEKNGYDTKVLNSWKGGSDGHTVATYEENGKIYYLHHELFDLISHRISSFPKGRGPFKSYKELGRAIQSNPKGIWVYDWKTFYNNYKHFPHGESLI